MSTDFNFTSEIVNNCLVIKTDGYINNVGGESIAGEFEKHFKDGVKQIVINLGGSNVVNSIGISYLIEIIEKLNDAEGKLIFTDMEPAIEKTLTIMGLFNFAGKAGSVDEAVKMF